MPRRDWRAISDGTVAPEVMDPEEYAGGIEGPVASPEEVEEQRRALKVAADAAVATTLHELHSDLVEHETLEGKAGPELCAAAVRDHADLIVVGPPRSSFWERLFSGSTVT